MTELTTGVLFLMSSLYGSGQADNHIANIASASANSATRQENAETLKETSIFTTKDPVMMEKYLRQIYADDPILVDIARCESSFRHYDKDGIIVTGRVNKSDVGVMQINRKYHEETAEKLGLDLYTIQGNTAYAKYLYDKEGTRPWKASEKCWSVGSAVASK